jgi:uncharacterized oligopeptide transporter (OPT) family protein
MLVAIGMYLPIGTTFAIFIGGMVRWVSDTIARRRGMNEAQKIRIESVGVLAASGMIAGEALMGLVTATFNLNSACERMSSSQIPSRTVLACRWPVRRLANPAFPSGDLP